MNHTPPFLQLAKELILLYYVTLKQILCILLIFMYHVLIPPSCHPACPRPLLRLITDIINGTARYCELIWLVNYTSTRCRLGYHGYKSETPPSYPGLRNCCYSIMLSYAESPSTPQVHLPLPGPTISPSGLSLESAPP